MHPPAVALMGATASGKTALALDLVERFPLDIVSVDSVMVYRGLDVGTAKPSPEELARAPHRLMDVADPSEVYSAARFRGDALREMNAVTASGRTPFLVGGTMLYFRALLRGIAPMPGADPKVRLRLNREADAHGWQALHARLAQVDPDAAARIHPNDPQRIQRALEVFERTGKTMTRIHAETTEPGIAYRVLKLAIEIPDRAQLHRRIETRLLRMLEEGLVQEVRGLRQRGDLNPDLPAMRAVGYRQVNEYLQGNGDYASMVRKAVSATRQLAKRQLTWLRSEPDLVWIRNDPKGRERAARLIQEHLDTPTDILPVPRSPDENR